MIEETRVTMDYSNGMTINLGGCETYYFLMGLASDLIGSIKSIKWVKGKYTKEDKEYACGDGLNTIAIIEKFSDSISQSIWIEGLYQKADILYKLVQSSVLNETIKGFYLFNRGKEYKIITEALSIFECFRQEQLKKCGSNDNSDFKYNEYNERFEAMFK